jgi:hypothetical protein
MTGFGSQNVKIMPYVKRLIPMPNFATKELASVNTTSQRLDHPKYSTQMTNARNNMVTYLCMILYLRLAESLIVQLKMTFVQNLRNAIEECVLYLTK